MIASTGAARRIKVFNLSSSPQIRFCNSYLITESNSVPTNRSKIKYFYSSSYSTELYKEEMNVKKYIAILKYSLKTQLTFLADYLFSLFSFTIHVFIFNELWDYILQGKNIVGYSKSELIWYIIIAECVTYSSLKSYKKIGDMVKQGDIANMLLKPVDIVNYLFAENSSVIIKMIVNMIWAIILGITLAGPIKVTGASIAFTLVTLILGVVIGILIQIFLGVLAFFTEENQSFYLVIQKLGLIVVFTPLEFYPKIVQKIFYFLPTTQMIYAPAKIFCKFNTNLAVELLVAEIISALVLYGILRIMYKKSVEKININGG